MRFDAGPRWSPAAVCGAGNTLAAASPCESLTVGPRRWASQIDEELDLACIEGGTWISRCAFDAAATVVTEVGERAANEPVLHRLESASSSIRVLVALR